MAPSLQNPRREKCSFCPFQAIVRIVAVVWIGFDEPRSVGVPSSVGALPIWLRFVKSATGGRIRGHFLRPRDIEEAQVDPATGALALRGCPERRSEFFLKGTVPEQVCPAGAVADAKKDGRGNRPFLEWLRRNL